MTDEEFVRKLGREIEAVLSREDNDEYLVNEEQFAKYIETREFFKSLVDEEFGDEMGTIELIPKMQCADLSVKLTVISFNGEEQIAELCKILSYASAFGVDATLDGKLNMDITIPGVFYHRDSKQ